MDTTMDTTMDTKQYYTNQLLTTSINIEPREIKGDINSLILYNIKKKYEGVCNKDGYIRKGSIKMIDRSVGEFKLIDNKSYAVFNITYQADIISPSIGNEITCTIESNNKMGLIGYIKYDKDDTLKDSPYIIIIPSELFESDAHESIAVGDTMKVSIVNFRIKYMSQQIQMVAKPV